MNGALFMPTAEAWSRHTKLRAKQAHRERKHKCILGLDGKRKKRLKTENTKASTRKKTKSAKCINPEDSGHLLNINEIPML